MDLSTIQAAINGHSMVIEVLPPVPGRVLHVDGDYMAYWAGVVEDAGTARAVAANKITKMQQLTRSERSIIHLTDDASSKADRRIIAETKDYQANRKGGNKPQNWAHLRAYMGSLNHGDITCKTWGQREADDGICYAAHLTEPGELHAIASADKDLRMIPGVHIDWNTFETTELKLGEFAVKGTNGKLYGHKWFWQQMLQGDTADHIPGIGLYMKPNGVLAACGEKTAEKLLSMVHNNADACAAVALQYELVHGKGWRRRFVEQALLLWMRRDRDATIWDVKEMFWVPDLEHELHYFANKIKEAYAQAESLGAGGAPRADVG